MSYAATVSGWHDFFIAIAAAAATLVGLLFVGLSLHLQTVVERADVRSLARITLSMFALLLIAAICLLTPEKDPSVHGIDLIITAAVTLVVVARSIVGGVRGRGGLSVIGVRLAAWRYGVAVMICALVGACGLLLLAGNTTEGLELMVPASAVGISIALRNTWDLLVTVAAARRRQDG